MTPERRRVRVGFANFFEDATGEIRVNILVSCSLTPSRTTRPPTRDREGDARPQREPKSGERHGISTRVRPGDHAIARGTRTDRGTHPGLALSGG